MGSSLAVLGRLWSSVLSAAAPIVPSILGRLSPFGATIQVPRCHSYSHSLFGVLTLTWSALVVIASSTKLAPGVVAKVCLSLSPHLSSLLTSFPVRHLVWSSSARWCRHLLGWPSASPVAAVHWDTWSHCCASALRSLSVPHPGHVGISLGSPPSAVRRWLSREAIPRLDRDLRLRLAAITSDLHGVRVDVSSDNFLPARENPVYSFNLPLSAVRLWGLGTVSSKLG